ncbi:asparagine synthase-domain-containing protein [Xylariaceae sp. FL0804]|nr:asparagine synthase-domain-containing protein [Xylariaceae sp. FL0804]
MCGIYACISVSEPSAASTQLKQFLTNRGPDHYGQVHREVAASDSDRPIHLDFTSTVLALRGDHITKQPLEHSASGSVLCWNGEAWKIAGEPVGGTDGTNDGEILISRLGAVPSASREDAEAHILDVLRSVEGPFAFVYFSPQLTRVYFGRDRLGRRSLLRKWEADSDSLILSSVADLPNEGWEEVQADGIYSLDLDVCNGPLDHRLSRHDWVSSNGLEMVSSIGVFNVALPPATHKLDFKSNSVDMLRHRLSKSLRLRVLNVPEPPSPTSDVDVRIAVLFSGGLDCTVLARLADELLPPEQGIDLINVAFENPRQVTLEQRQPHLQAADKYEGCPDRATGRKAFEELQAACPGRYFRFIAVNVSFEEAMLHKRQIVSLMYPHDTEMDLSIAFALYFAARGTGDGYIGSAAWLPSPPTVNTPARVLLSGLGADELFGGYSRHEIAFKRGGYPDLISELRLDISRIGLRNLGRDDRIMAHWGKEVRFPYLDEGFVRFAIDLPVAEKCDFQNHFHPAVIDPAKRVLRLLADQLGLPIAARQKKKAIQFGSRTAKIESATGKGRGTATISMPATST